MGCGAARRGSAVREGDHTERTTVGGDQSAQGESAVVGRNRVNRTRAPIALIAPIAPAFDLAFDVATARATTLVTTCSCIAVRAMDTVHPHIRHIVASLESAPPRLVLYEPLPPTDLLVSRRS